LRLFLPRLEAAFKTDAISAEQSAGGMEQVFEQLALPCIPNPGAGAANVGNGEQIQRDQAAVLADPLCKGPDDIRIGEILLLCGRRHDEMMLDQPRDKIGVIPRQTMRSAKPAGIDLAELRMIATATFGDIVKQRGKVEHFRPGEIAHQAAAQGKFVGELGDGKAPQIPDDAQNVLVHGIDVIEIMLHLADNSTERGQVTPENAALIHPPQCAFHV
jgi:hypothetical protein